MYTFVLINIFLSFNGMSRRNIFGFVFVWVSLLVFVCPARLEMLRMRIGDEFCGGAAYTS